MEKKIGNRKQLLGCYEMILTGGSGYGKRCLFVYNRELECLLNLDNALDIVFLRFRGVNMSFLSKNGLNSCDGEFENRFEGGFLYTCGLDNLSACIAGRKVHGSLHDKKATLTVLEEGKSEIVISGFVKDCALFGKNLELRRRYVIGRNKISLTDEILNNAFSKAEYALLYHVNFGYPFLDEKMKIYMPIVRAEGLTPRAQSEINRQFDISLPSDEGEEEVFYNELKEGNVILENQNIRCSMKYDTEKFPVTLQWKSMLSGDYALGIEPSTTRFDEFRFEKLAGGCARNYRLDLEFEDIDG